MSENKQIEFLTAQMDYFYAHKETLTKADRLAFLGQIIALIADIKQEKQKQGYKDE